VKRVYRALEACTVTLLTERRRLAPHGANGAGDGAVGRNAIAGRELPAKCREQLQPGGELTIDTPGGGGWADPRVSR
jgi:N-methylhydantoinase B